MVLISFLRTDSTQIFISSKSGRGKTFSSLEEVVEDSKGISGKTSSGVVSVSEQEQRKIAVIKNKINFFKWNTSFNAIYINSDRKMLFCCIKEENKKAADKKQRGFIMQTLGRTLAYAFDVGNNPVIIGTCANASAIFTNS